ncbi:hypothetical protein [Polynucleobacter ibericus]|uniref:hypothetical protein n=1 Tax=Polynucleobacter ibericus TaxID=1819725 RepID=UPI001BFE01F6|nr:hypothetical protein [Polynucleobacter ibericus]QWE08318.1 hypothetical protein AOC20_07790 [Polynucleobacter ibericus]
MNIQNIAALGLLTLAFTGFAGAQPKQDKQMSPNYVESCTEQQIQMHQKVKDISADQFRSFCECTSKQLINNLSAAQLNELNKSSKKPAWFKSAEDVATKSCLQSMPKTQV